MPDKIKKQIDILIELQKIEIETDSIKSKLGDVSRRFDKLDAGLRESEHSLKSDESYLDELKKKYRDFESDAQMNISRIKKSRERLGAVKNNKEYQSMLKEIEELSAKNYKVEDEMIECLELSEKVEKDISSKKDEFLQLAEQLKLEKENIEQETEQQKKRLALLELDWKKMSDEIEPDLFKKFNRVKETQGGGIAIVPVKNAVCQGCNVNIPPQMYNELFRGNSLRFCPNCQRIIYLQKQ